MQGLGHSLSAVQPLLWLRPTRVGLSSCNTHTLHIHHFHPWKLLIGYATFFFLLNKDISCIPSVSQAANILTLFRHYFLRFAHAYRESENLNRKTKNQQTQVGAVSSVCHTHMPSTSMVALWILSFLMLLRIFKEKKSVLVFSYIQSNYQNGLPHNNKSIPIRFGN